MMQTTLEQDTFSPIWPLSLATRGPTRLLDIEIGVPFL